MVQELVHPQPVDVAVVFNLLALHQITCLVHRGDQAVVYHVVCSPQKPSKKARMHTEIIHVGLLKDLTWILGCLFFAARHSVSG